MNAPLDDLIQRLTLVVNDSETRPLHLHWSDVELLNSLRRDQLDQAASLTMTRLALAAALQLLADGSKR